MTPDRSPQPPARSKYPASPILDLLFAGGSTALFLALTAGLIGTVSLCLR
jgi:hypothetical protein